MRADEREDCQSQKRQLHSRETAEGGKRPFHHQLHNSLLQTAGAPGNVDAMSRACGRFVTRTPRAATNLPPINPAAKLAFAAHGFSRAAASTFGRLPRRRRRLLRRRAGVGRRERLLILHVAARVSAIACLARLVQTFELRKLAVGVSLSTQARIDEEELVVNAGV